MSYIDYVALNIVESIDTEELSKAIKEGIKEQCNLELEQKDIQSNLEAVLMEFIIDMLESVSYESYSCKSKNCKSKTRTKSNYTLDDWNIEENKSKEVKKKVINLDNWTIEEVLGDSNASK